MINDNVIGHAILVVKTENFDEVIVYHHGGSFQTSLYDVYEKTHFPNGKNFAVVFAGDRE